MGVVTWRDTSPVFPKTPVSPPWIKSIQGGVGGGDRANYSWRGGGGTVCGYRS